MQNNVTGSQTRSAKLLLYTLFPGRLDYVPARKLK